MDTKTLFVYYSFSGNGDLIAEAFREKGAEVRKVTPKRNLPKSFFWSVMTGGFLATIGHKSPLKGFDSDLSGYDKIVIGSPIWNGRLSCPINTVLSDCDLAGKDIAFVLYAGGGEAPGAAERLRQAYPNATVTVLKDPKKYPEELEKLKDIE